MDFKGSKNWRIRFINPTDYTQGFFVEADKLDPEHPYNIEVLQEDSGNELYPNTVKMADAKLMVAANRLAMEYGSLERFESRYYEQKELLIEAAEILNLFAAKLQIQVEGAHLKSDAESYGVHEVLERIKEIQKSGK